MGLSVLTPEQVVSAAQQAIMSGGGWPPSVGQFVEMGQGGGFDYEEAFDRMINKKPEGDVEFWASQEVGFKCRGHLPEDKARNVHKKAIDKYLKRQATDSLPDRNVQMISQDPKTKKAGKDWLAPNGNYYRCPSEYYAEKFNEDKK